MDAYIYDSDIYCDDCGRAIRERLDAEGKTPADPDDESTYDSGDYPKGPFGDGGGESNAPQHCGACGVFLENPLTDVGIQFLTDAGVGPDISDTLREWCSHYGIHCDTPEDKENRAKFDAIRMENGKLPAFAFPGGYPLLYQFGDGETCCPACANGENRSDASPVSDESQWRLVGWFIHYEGEPEVCSQCDAKIESAYGDPDEPDFEAD